MGTLSIVTVAAIPLVLVLSCDVSPGCPLAPDIGYPDVRTSTPAEISVGADDDNLVDDGADEPADPFGACGPPLPEFQVCDPAGMVCCTHVLTECSFPWPEDPDQTVICELAFWTTDEREAKRCSDPCDPWTNTYTATCDPGSENPSWVLVPLGSPLCQQ